MNKYRKMPYASRIKWRIRLQYLLLICLLIYMVAIAELGGGNSRILTNSAQNFTRLVIFGGMAYIISRILRNKKLLENRLLLKEQMLEEQDERNQYLHDKSGGLVMDLLLACLLFITLTASAFNMAAFYTAFAGLSAAILLKAAAYCYYSHL